MTRAFGLLIVCHTCFSLSAAAQRLEQRLLAEDPGTQQQPGGFYRIRYTGGPAHVPSGLHARSGGVEMTFTGAVDRETALDASRYFVKIWSLKRTKEYGSDHFDEHTLQVTSVRVTPDAHSVFLEIPEIQPTQCMEIRYELKSANGEKFSGAIHNTIHRLADP